MRTSTSIKKRITRVHNELTEIKFDLQSPDVSFTDHEAELLVNETMRILKLAESITKKIMSIGGEATMTEIEETTSPYAPRRHYR